MEFPQPPDPARRDADAAQRALIRAILTAACACIAVFAAGCGSRDSRAIVYNCAANALEIDSLQREIPSFTARTGIELTLNPFSGDDKLYAMLAAGSEPDIFYTNTVVAEQLAAQGRLLDLRPFLDHDPIGARLQPSIRAALTRGPLSGYSLPNWVFTCGVYYNKRAFDAAHLAYPDSSWTWDDMVRCARLLTGDDNRDGRTDRYGIYIPSHFIEAFETMNHAPIPRDEFLAAIPSESREVYRKYLSLMQEGIMPDIRRVQAMGMQSVQMLANGTVAMLVEAVPNTAIFDGMRIPWGLAPIPRFAGKSPRYFRSGSGGLSISARTKHPRAAWTALTWIICGAGIYQPNPVLRDADFTGGWERRYPQLKGNGFADVWDRSIRYDGGDARYFVRFSSITMHAILDGLQPMLDKLWAREISVDQVVAALPGINATAIGAVRRFVDETRTAAESPSFPSADRRTILAYCDSLQRNIDTLSTRVR